MAINKKDIIKKTFKKVGTKLSGDRIDLIDLKKLIKLAKFNPEWVKPVSGVGLGPLGAATVAAASPALYGAYKYKKELEAGTKSNEMVAKLAEKRRQQIISKRKRK